MPKDLDETKSLLQSPLLLNGIVFEGMHVGRVPTMKFKDWDLAIREKFPHLETKNIMNQNIAGVVTMLELRKWLHSVEKAGLLNLL